MESSSTNSAQEFSVDLLRIYYSRLFPYKQLFDWFSYGNDPQQNQKGTNKEYFPNREWSFTIEDDIYIRYQSFSSLDEMRSNIQKRQPHKIDIGAVFNHPPKDHTKIKPELFHTMERELVFDIDMTDYDSIRTCCKGANICNKCWPFMTMALKVVDKILREDFGYRHILWIYSGRRGIHCWVNDSSARKLSNEARGAVVGYMSVEVKSGEETSDKNIVNGIFGPNRHPMIKKVYDLLEPYFERYIADDNGQGIFATPDRWIRISRRFRSIAAELEQQWSNDRLTGLDRWRMLKEATTLRSVNDYNQQANKKKKSLATPELEARRYELIFEYCYPRLDVNVSKAQNHLLKSPFCVHPKTGRVCVPINPQNADEFDPFAVPTVRTLCQEIDDYDRNHRDSEEVDDVNKSSMKDAIDTFNTCMMNGLWQDIRMEFRNRAAEERNMDW